MAKKKKSLSLSKIFWVLVLTVILFYGWRYRTKGIVVDESEICGRFESESNEILAQAGITESDILTTSHREHKRKIPLPTLWIETERKVRVPRQVSIYSLIHEISSCERSHGIQLLSHTSLLNSSIVEYGKKDGEIFQKFIFLRR